MLPDLLIHVRHGETDWNLARRLQGSQNIPLNATGRQQAARNGRELKRQFALLGRSPEDLQWVSSPMDRSRETMEIIRREIGLVPDDYRVDPLLTEISFGRLEGYTYEEMADVDPDGYHVLRTDKWHFLPPGGESYVMLTDRVRRSLASLGGDALIVSHGGVFRALLGLIDGRADQDLAEMAVPQDQIFIVAEGRQRWA